jgi:hypothetical protein
LQIPFDWKLIHGGAKINPRFSHQPDNDLLDERAFVHLNNKSFNAKRTQPAQNAATISFGTVGRAVLCPPSW